MSRVVVLGAGPAGLAAALDLAERGFEVEILEREAAVGGLSGSFEVADIRVDYGSHRLHPATPEPLLAQIRTLLGDDLLQRPRHGRILLDGRWVHFPIQPLDLLLQARSGFVMGVAADGIRKLFTPRRQSVAEAFSEALRGGLGSTLCEAFYFPYARKIWGLEPAMISAELAQKRVSAGSMGKLIRRLLPGGVTAGNTKGTFFYPRRGFGQISEAFRDAALRAGARLHLGAQPYQVEVVGSKSRVSYRQHEREQTLSADQIYSTVPLDSLVRWLSPEPPESVLQAAGKLDFRAMVLVYLVLGRTRLTEFDAHYFPGPEFPFTRVSEPKNYAAAAEPAALTVICAELPCQQGDPTWQATDQQLAESVWQGLVVAGLAGGEDPISAETRRIPCAYPLYRKDFRGPLRRIDEWLGGLDGILTFGRQGLFTHDNIHHALYAGQAAARCLREDGSLDREAWQREREIFATHVVED